MSRRAISRVLGAFQVFHDAVVGRKNFRPPGLSLGEQLGHLEVFEILVVAPNLDHVVRALEVMPPLF